MNKVVAVATQTPAKIMALHHINSSVSRAPAIGELANPPNPVNVKQIPIRAPISDWELAREPSIGASKPTSWIRYQYDDISIKQMSQLTSTDSYAVQGSVSHKTSQVVQCKVNEDQYRASRCAWYDHIVNANFPSQKGWQESAECARTIQDGELKRSVSQRVSTGIGQG